MNHASRVRGRETRDQLKEQTVDLLRGQWSVLPEMGGQRFALQEFHGQEQGRRGRLVLTANAGVHAEIEGPTDVGMGDPVSQPCSGFI